MNISIDNIRKNAYMIVNNIAMLFIRKSNNITLSVVDLNNLKYVAEFKYDKPINSFSLVHSTFADGKRKYEMLYYVERNKEEILEGYNHAKI